MTSVGTSCAELASNGNTGTADGFVNTSPAEARHKEDEWKKAHTLLLSSRKVFSMVLEVAEKKCFNPLLIINFGEQITR